MFDSAALLEWYKNLFILSNRLQPSEIENMTFMDLKIYIMLFNDWVKRKNQK